MYSSVLESRLTQRIVNLLFTISYQNSVNVLEQCHHITRHAKRLMGCTTLFSETLRGGSPSPRHSTHHPPARRPQSYSSSVAVSSRKPPALDTGHGHARALPLPTGNTTAVFVHDPVDPSFRALSGSLKCTVRLHKFKMDSPSCA